MGHGSGDHPTRPRTPPTPEHGLPSLMHHGVTAALVAAFLGLGIWYVLKDDPPVPSFDASADTLAEARETRADERMERAREVYQLRFATEADGTKRLVREGLLVPRDLYYGRDANP